MSKHLVVSSKGWEEGQNGVGEENGGGQREVEFARNRCQTGRMFVGKESIPTAFSLPTSTKIHILGVSILIQKSIKQREVVARIIISKEKERSARMERREHIHRQNHLQSEVPISIFDVQNEQVVVLLLFSQ